MKMNLEYFTRRFLRPLKQWQVERYLAGRAYMAPGLRKQKLWSEVLNPELQFQPGLGSWKTLQRFTVPLIQELASSAHAKGIEAFHLNRFTSLSFDAFIKKVADMTSWQIHECNIEIEPKEFFRLLAKKHFPCVRSLRPIDRVFCGSTPDFWHEAIGHIAPLTDPCVSDFYQFCGQLVCELFDRDQSEDAEKLMQVLWVLLEYGLLNENGRTVTFGAALTGSYMALHRWKLDYISSVPFDIKDILSSRIYEDGAIPKRDACGRIAFYEMSSFEETKHDLKVHFSKL